MCPATQPWHASGITTSRWDVVVVVSTMRAAAMLRNECFASSRTSRVVAVWEIAVYERDRHSQREEKMTPEDKPPRVTRMCRVSLVASTMLLRHGLRCSGATHPMESREEATISRKSFRVPHGTNILSLLSTSAPGYAIACCLKQ